MVGIPYETPSAILDTIKLNAEIAVDTMQITIYQPYKGTQLAELCQEKGFVESLDLDTDFFSPSILQLDSVTPSHILMFRDYFKVLVRYYRALQKLPGSLSEAFIKRSDSILSAKLTPKVLNAAYIPLNYLFRKGQLLTSKIKAAQYRSRKSSRVRTTT